MTSLFLALILAWDPSPTPGVKYRLYYGPNSGQQTIFEDDITSTTWEVKNLPPGVPIYFVVRAYIGVQESGPSNEVVYTQSVPTPTPAPNSAGPTVEATRLAVAPNEVFQAIVRNGPGNITDWVTLAPIEDPITVERNYWKYLTDARTIPRPGLTDATLTFSTPVSGTYELRFYANNDFILIARSGPIVVATVPTATPTPSWQQSKITDLRVASGTKSSVTITWTKPSEAVNHIVYWDNDPVLDHSQYDGTPPNAIKNLVPGTTYYFEVRALNGAGVPNQPSNRVTYTP
jgi:Fibronectin type III domain